MPLLHLNLYPDTLSVNSKYKSMREENELLLPIIQSYMLRSFLCVTPLKSTELYDTP